MFCLKFREFIVFFNVVKILEYLLNVDVEYLLQSLCSLHFPLSKVDVQSWTNAYTLYYFVKTISCTFILLQNANRPSFSSEAKKNRNTNTTCFKCLEDKRKLLEKNNGAYNVKQQKKITKSTTKTSKCISDTLCNVKYEIVVGEKKTHKHTNWEL